MEDIGGNAPPQQIHDMAGTVIDIDAGSAQFQNFTGLVHNRADVIFIDAVELPMARGGLSPDQSIGANDRFGTVTQITINHQQMICNIVKSIHIALAARGFRTGMGGHFFIEDPVPKRLRRINKTRIPIGEPNSKIVARQLR
jgi:hypothetical protein